MSYPIITLLPGKDVPIRAGHPWVFSQAVATDVQTENGGLVEVRSSRGEPLGIGTRNGQTSIRIRMITRDVTEPIDATFFATRFRALRAWKEKHLPPKTTGYRLVHAESDGIPGLIIDRYTEVFVVQLHTAGMELLRQTIVDALIEVFAPQAIVERSDVSVRRTEGLHNEPVGVLYGKVDDAVPFLETGLTFLADVLGGQKTGFFLDQREARARVGSLATGRRVLNLFGYSGGFSVHAAYGGARLVVTADVSRKALDLAKRNFQNNGFDAQDEERFIFSEVDIMKALDRHDPLPHGPFDLIICDPPAFAKSERHLEQAVEAYTNINARCLSMLSPGGILVTSSCSGRVDPELFRNMLRHAAGRADRKTRVLDWIGHAVDHAEALAFPEGRYLKTAIIEVV